MTRIYSFNPHILSDSDFIVSPVEENSMDSMLSREITTSIMKQHY